jgi:hypothetical protein
MVDRLKAMLADQDGPKGAGGDSARANLEALASEADASRKAARGGAAKRQQSLDAARNEAELATLFEAEQWEELAALYFNARFVVTGYDHFLLTEAEKKRLSVTLATTAKVLIRIKPEYIALLLFGLNFGGIVLSKEYAYSQEVKKREAAA